MSSHITCILGVCMLSTLVSVGLHSFILLMYFQCNWYVFFFCLLCSHFVEDLCIFLIWFLCHRGAPSGDLRFCSKCFSFPYNANLIMAQKTNVAVLHILTSPPPIIQFTMLCMCNLCPISSFYLYFTYNCGPFATMTIYNSSFIANICILYQFFQTASVV